MPAGDRTGPAGMGAMTGRSAGYCAGYAAPDYMSAGPRGGFVRGGGFGRGGGRGFGRGFGFGARQGNWGQDAVPYAVPPVGVGPTAEQELGALKQQSEYLSDTLKNIQERMTELESKQSGK